MREDLDQLEFPAFGNRQEREGDYKELLESVTESYTRRLRWRELVVVPCFVSGLGCRFLQRPSLVLY